MARAGWKKPISDRRLSDLVSVGLLTRVFPPELVDEVIAEVGRTEVGGAARREPTAPPSGRCGDADVSTGSNGYRIRAWKSELAKLAAETGLRITACHYPPGTSKWNRIEHRMFSFITMNWRSKPLTTLRTVIELISGTSTTTGLTIKADYDLNWYPKGVKITDAQLAAIPLAPHTFHSDPA
jgi:hypothetical protein